MSRSFSDPRTSPEGPPTSSAPSGDDVTLRPDADGDADAPSVSQTAWRGRFVGRFVLLERLGRGGMGVVYLAYDPELDRRVAVKLVTAEGAGEEAATARLLREAQALAQLSHPNIVAVHDVGRVGTGIYVAMEYVEGATLGAWLRERPRRCHEIVAVFAAAGRGIAAAHEAGLVHRDIKPDNIMVGRDQRVRVLDFGLARSSGMRPGTGEGGSSRNGTLGAGNLDLQLTAVGAVMGTPVYMAPEQYAGALADARSDIYSLCVALWEAMHGRRPFAGDSLPELADNVLAGRLVETGDARVPA
ncbi:MAG: serine/threonine protein kinase, partial [Myxococcales bacterium]|nr:serine/threonine protein kinase [Myxococcales bacterium]